MKNALVLCSGGIDSVTSAFYAKKELGYDSITILFFDYNQRNLQAEEKSAILCAKTLNAKFIRTRLSWLGKLSTSKLNSSEAHSELSLKSLKNTKKESQVWYVPSRNLSFFSFALSLAESLFIKTKKHYDIIFGFKNEGSESFPDTSEEFINELNKLSKISTESKPKIIAPMIKKDKEDIIKLGTSLGIDYSKTFSCYSSGKMHCGSCLSCRLRQEGFYWANAKDPTEYKEKPKDYRTI